MPVFLCASVEATRIARCWNTTLYQLMVALLAAHVYILSPPPTRHLEPLQTPYTFNGAVQNTSTGARPMFTYAVMQKVQVCRDRSVHSYGKERQEVLYWG